MDSMAVIVVVEERWGDAIGLDPTTKEGWTETAMEFWLLPAGMTAGVTILFALTFWDRTDMGLESDPSPEADQPSRSISGAR